MNSIEYYSDISNDYKEIASKRQAYLSAIDREIIQLVKQYKANPVFLDIGTGDGRRASILSNAINSKYAIGIDNCSSMFNDSTYDLQFKELDITKNTLNEEFDVATALWNVFGHLGNEMNRTSALVNINESLKPGGLLFIDVNNRYNIKQYGLAGVLINLFRDLIQSEKSGYYKLTSNLSETEVYIHSPNELEKLAHKTGFKLKNKIILNYQSGEREKSLFFGQLLYCFEKK